MNDVVLSCKNVSKKYTEFKTDIAILKDVNLEIKKGRKSCYPWIIRIR